MSNTSKRAVLVVALSLAAAVPTTARASAVDLGTAAPFVVLGGSTVTNTGVSFLGGDLGVSPGSALVGFGTAVVGGATHATDAVALQAQSDLTTAYNVAAGQPVAPARDLTGTDLGNRTLTPGAYRFSSSAKLTGPLTLDGQGDPAAQFVFEIGSTLTTATGSSVLLINGASACHVFWQVGSSATIGTTTAFQGSVLALTSISMNTGATAIGRMLARNGAVTLQSNVLTRPGCAAGSTTPPAGTPSGGTPPTGTPPVTVTPTPPGRLVPTGGSGLPEAPPAPVNSPATPPLAVPVPPVVVRGGSTTLVASPRASCTTGFRATVRGSKIKSVVFAIDGRRLSTALRSPFRVYVLAAPGRHKVTARVTFKDARRARTMTVPYRACAAAVLKPRPGPAVFTG